MKVQNNLLASRYELYAEGNLAMTLSYHMEAGQMWMLSLDAPVPGMFQNWADGFLQEVFQDVHRRRLEVLPFSPKARAFVMKNDAYLRLVPKTTPGHFPDLRLAAAIKRRRRTKVKASRAKASSRKQAISSEFFGVRSGVDSHKAKRSMAGKKRAFWFQTTPAVASVDQRRLHPSYGNVS